MIKFNSLVSSLALIFFPLSLWAVDVETIVIMRHGEKLPLDAKGNDLGQLSCQGVNRSFALPQRLTKLFDTRPYYLFAPNPTVKKGINTYVRPLATLMPTAISLNLPIDLTFGFNANGKEIANYLLNLPKSTRSTNLTVFVAWEHNEGVKLARAIAAQVNYPEKNIPEWNQDDFDKLYVFKITRDGDKVPAVDFKVEQEGLNSLSTSCPNTAVHSNAAPSSGNP